MNKIKICLIDEYSNRQYFYCQSAEEILKIIDNLDFIVGVYKYEHYTFRNTVEKCDYVLEEFIY